MNFFLCKNNTIKAFLGLDNAGKTSLVQLMSTGVVHQSAPTMHPTTEEVSFGRCLANNDAPREKNNTLYPF